MNRNSLILNMTFFFIIIFISINIFFYFYYITIKNTPYSISFFILFIDFLLISFYIFLYRKFKPLKKLKELTDSRSLFLQNIMHELKTPINKGKLITDTLKDSKRKDILQRNFYRLEYLLGEISKIEELTSGKIKLKRNDFIVEELLNQAIDILSLDKTKFDIKLIDKIINVDFELFSIALKNLIDNSIKYNTKGKAQIEVTKKSIIIRNKGLSLKNDIFEYYKPFNREYETVKGGLGLGLYISNNIIKLHGFKLQYEYINGYHSFKIIF